jgi:hypothetical protein
VSQPGDQRCACARRPRRRCDLCAAPAGFLACSRSCLDRHLPRAHGTAVQMSAAARAAEYQREVNRLGRDAWDPYEGHRMRLTALVTALQRGEGLCVLGAGNGNDLDLSLLTREFGEVHLVDLDPEALQRALARAPEQARARVRCHAPVDLSGMMDQLDHWGDGLPDAQEMALRARIAARALAQQIGRTFDVVLSSCALSQLCHPFQNTWALSGGEWQRLFDAVTALHLETMAALTRPGGTGVVACDVLCYAGEAVAETARQVPRSELASTLAARIASGAIAPNPDPQALAALLQSGRISPTVERPQITEPWLWDLGSTVQLVYGVLFRRV